jgi:hypothetical protein
MAFGLVIGFIELLQNATTSNYNATINSNALQFITAHIKPSQSAGPSPVVTWLLTLNNIASSASVFTPLPTRNCLTTN